ncbi:MAG: UvrD-helicase domain-containing protein [Verrucomicrobiia bacterium]
MSSFTENQRRAIELRGNVLVVAGAGTGKTRTLVQRCLEWLLEAPGEHSIDQILMVTFTEAAAAEMRRRLREALKKEQENHPGDHRFTEQLALLDTAFISTLHSFCLRLVREHFYELELDPQLSVLAEEEARLRAEETLSNVLQRHYAGASPESKAVQALIHGQGRGWDVPVRRLVLRLHTYTQTLPDPEGWFSQQRDLFTDTEPTKWCEWLGSALAEWSRAWLPLLSAVEKPTPNTDQCIAALEALPGNPTVLQARVALGRICEAFRLDWPRGSAKAVRDEIKDFFQEAGFLEGLTKEVCPLPTDAGDEETDRPEFSAPEPLEPLRQDWNWVRSEMLTLLDLTREFGREYAQVKRELGVVDFHDLEQFSLRLLWDPARQQPTPLAGQWRKRLRMVLVDEYQDINAAQDTILRALGGEGPEACRFMVGDPKQSIYRFRLAAPHIFQAYTEVWRRDAGQGQVVALTDNFRSREGILHFANAFFETAMRKEMGGVSYDELARLRFGDPTGRSELSSSFAAAQDGTGQENRLVPLVEMHLRLPTTSEGTAPEESENSEAPDGASPVSAELEARLIGLRLRSLRESGRLVWDAEARQHRPVEWRDMVILLRSPYHKVEAYAKQFERLGIPLSATRSGFFESQEIRDLLSLLQLLDNPLQDVPLLAALRSPFGRFTFDQLALVRLCSKGRFWLALQQFHRLFQGGTEAFSEAQVRAASRGEPSPYPRLMEALRDPGLRRTADEAWVRADQFLTRYGRWRRLIRETSLSQCLDRILAESCYTAFLPVEARGQQQRGNLAKLLAWARRFDQVQRQGLYRFLKFIEAQQEAEIDHEPAPIESSDAVRLMSIHQSKGLEFNVVVVADLGKAFNLADLRAGIILDPEFGLCPMVKPPFTEQRYPSLPHWLAQRRQRKETLGEEMRLLYVAMTRACQCLILTGTAKRKAPERWQKRAGLTAERDLLSASNCLDWLGPWVTHHTGRPDWTEQAEGATGLFQWFVHRDDNIRAKSDLEPEANSPAQPLGQPPRPGVSEQLSKRLAWTYPFNRAVSQAVKLSVSSVRMGILEAADGSVPRLPRRFGVAPPGAEEGLTPTAAGTAHHTFLELVSLEALDDAGRLSAEAEQMVQRGVLTPEERGALDLESIAAFWRSVVGQELLAQRHLLQRELPFTARFTLEELARFQAMARDALTGTSDHRSSAPDSGLDQEFVVVTGVVDLVALLPKEIWLLDFKTDAADGEVWKEIASRYEPQIRMYALALSRVYRRPVTRAWLHALRLRQTIAVGIAAV